jgi:hypothetical protein
MGEVLPNPLSVPDVGGPHIPRGGARWTCAAEHQASRSGGCIARRHEHRDLDCVRIRFGRPERVAVRIKKRPYNLFVPLETQPRTLPHRVEPRTTLRARKMLKKLGDLVPIALTRVERVSHALR